MWTKCEKKICAKTCNRNPVAKPVLSYFNGRSIMTTKDRQKSYLSLLYYHFLRETKENLENNHVASIITIIRYIGFEVFTPEVMESYNFWDMTPCSLLKFMDE
jgi:hypothetical protein